MKSLNTCVWTKQTNILPINNWRSSPSLLGLETPSAEVRAAACWKGEAKWQPGWRCCKNRGIYQPFGVTILNGWGCWGMSRGIPKLYPSFIPNGECCWIWPLSAGSVWDFGACVQRNRWIRTDKACSIIFLPTLGFLSAIGGRIWELWTRVPSSS